MTMQKEDIFMDFMKKHSYLSKKCAKGNRIEIESLWKTIANNLHSNGPTIKGTEKVK